VPLALLLVDDSIPVRERLALMLAAIVGVVVVGHASEAEIAIREILVQRPHVVVLDLQLAQGHGFDVLRGVCPVAPEIDFYVLSNFSAPGYRQAAGRLGARAFFDKSTEFPQLVELIGRHGRLRA
jgi:DNA-binding NarL/FixJ family response regulator